MNERLAPDPTLCQKRARPSTACGCARFAASVPGGNLTCRRACGDLGCRQMRCRVPECSPTVGAPRGKICPLYQEGGARDVRSSSDASKGCSLAILETHCGHPQESGVSQS